MLNEKHEPIYCAYAIVYNGNQWSVGAWESVQDARNIVHGDPKKSNVLHFGTEIARVNSIESAWAIMPKYATPTHQTVTVELWESL